MDSFSHHHHGMAQWHQQMLIHRPHASTRSIVAHGFGNPWKSFAPKPSFFLRQRYGPTFSGGIRPPHSSVFDQCAYFRKSYLRYHRFRSIFAPLFGSLSGVTTNDSDAPKTHGSGLLDSSKVFVTGNMKFDAALGSQSRPSTLDIPALLGAHDMHEKTLLLGSGTMQRKPCWPICISSSGRAIRS